MVYSEEYRSIEHDVKGILESEIPERCQPCPMFGVAAGVQAVEAAFAHEAIDHEKALKRAREFAHGTGQACILGVQLGDAHNESLCRYMKRAS